MLCCCCCLSAVPQVCVCECLKQLSCDILFNAITYKTFVCGVLHSRNSFVTRTDGKQLKEPDDFQLSVASICTPSRQKPPSQLHPKLHSPAGGKRSTAAVDSKLALASFCTPSRAKCSVNARRDRVPHPHSTSLPLPHSYYILGELFQSADTILSWLTNRAEICTFDKLKSAVQDMTKRYERHRSLCFLH